MTTGLDWTHLRVRPSLLRWAVSVFCVLVGALMLVAPHQFAGPPFAFVRPSLTAWGTAFFVAGAGSIATSAIGVRGPFAAVSSVVAGLALLVLAFGFLLSDAWTGVAVYTVFGVAMALGPLLDRGGSRDESGPDLFILTAALAAVVNAVLLLAIPGPGITSVGDLLVSARSWYAFLFLLGGVGVLTTRLARNSTSLGRGSTQAVLGVAYLAWLLVGGAIPARIWTGILFYGGVAVLLLLGPRLDRYVRRVDSSSLRVRLALAMASAAAVPLLVVATIATGWQEQAAAEQQLELQEALAGGLAADVSGALTQHLVGLALVAEHPVVLSRSSASPSVQDAALGDVGEVAPGLVALGTFDSASRPIVALGIRAVDPQTRLPEMAREALRRMPSGSSSTMTFLSQDQPPSIVLAAPIRQTGGALAGIAVGELDRGWLMRRLQRGIGDATLSAVVVDERGRIVVMAGDPVAGAGDVARRPSVLAAREPGAVRGRLRFTAGPGEFLAGYARVPETSWAVIVEQPTSSALASVWASRELTFAVLLAAFVAAAALGVVLADRLAAPLASMARAAQALAAGAPSSAISVSRIYEVRMLARAFSRMQARLAARTAERERAEARLRVLADASGELTRSLEESAIVRGLASIVVRELADWCAVDALDDHGRLRRTLTLHRDPGRQAIAETLTEPMPTFGPGIDHPALSSDPVLLPTVTPRQLAAMSPSAEYRRALEWLGMRSLIVVPLRARDRTLGALICVYGRGARRYDAEDLAVAQELALRAALAIDNARLYAAERTARAEAEAAVRVREEFLAVAAHELKTPLTSLRGFAELGVRALDRGGSIEPAIARRTFDAIDRQSARLTALVANLLEVARGSADRGTIAPRAANLVELVRNVVEAAQVRAERHPISLDAPDVVELMVDPLRIEQVITNLVDNAVKYSPVGSSIEVCIVPGREQVEVAVRDHGMGVPLEHHHRIFDRFFQAHVGDQSSGMGLGLYISQEIVWRHGGTIRVELPADGGTRMVVSLPLVLPEAVAPPPEATAPETTASRA